jgi:uncharacterized membrane protein YkvA (DUF1232 family)
VVAYAFRPIDVVSDPIPVLGYLDDLVIIPVGVAITMVPPQILAERREQACGVKDRPVGNVGAVMVVAVWLVTRAV